MSDQATNQWKIDAMIEYKTKKFKEVVGRNPDAAEHGMIVDSVLSELDCRDEQQLKSSAPLPK